MTKASPMYSYQAYGLTIHSDLALPDLFESEGPADVLVRLQPLPVERLRARPSGGDRIWGRIYNDLQFLVEGGHTIAVDVRRPIGDDVLRQYVLGVLMATLLRQRGLLVVHACGVARDGRAIGFVGESGWGKSTLAESFCQRGYDLLTDDVMAVQVEPEPVALPSYPQIRLRPGSGTHLVEAFEALPRVNAATEKRSRSGQRVPEQPTPLEKLYVLDGTYAEANAIEPLPASEAILRLIRHTRATNLLTDAASTARHLDQCVRLVRAVPVVRLHRRRALDALPDLLDLVERDLGVRRGEGIGV